MFDRRNFLGALLATATRSAWSAGDSGAEDPAGAIERLRTLYGSLKSYVDITRSTAVVLGMKVPGENRTAYAAGSLCMQSGVRNQVTTCYTVEGDRCRQWNREKGWRDIRNLDLILAGMHGARVMLGPAPQWLSLLLFDRQRMDAEGIRALTNVTCRSAALSCSVLQGTLDDDETNVKIECDTGSGAMRRILSEDFKRRINVDASIEARLNAPLDISALIQDLHLDPDRPLKVAGERA